jgi:ribosomal protein S12 methylthiotransferase accessory factor
MTAGYGCHPVAAQAAVRAINEAAQSRITNIAGSRDDFDPGEYGQALSKWGRSLGEPKNGFRNQFGGSAWGDLETQISYLKSELKGRGVGSLVAVPLGGETMGVSVVKLFAEGLEDRAPNDNWRPRSRAIAATLGLI